MTAARTGYLPDGHGLSPEARELVDAGVGGPVHLRLTSPDGRSARGACEQPSALGQWWTGLPAEVTCPGCLELVHA